MIFRPDNGSLGGRLTGFGLLPIALLVAGAPSAAHADHHKSPAAAVAVLKKHCYVCHGIDFKVDGLDMLDIDVLTADRGEDYDRYITPGSLDDSLVWTWVESGEMPPATRPPLSDAEKESIKHWIEQGAEWPTEGAEQREFIGEREILRVILDDLRKVRREDARFQRYFSLAHLYNNPDIDDATLRLHRAGLSKAVNSLSTRPDIKRPVAIDDAESIFRIDLRHYGWQSLDVWGEVLEAYPYGIKPREQIALANQGSERSAKELFDEIEEEYGEVRFDGIAYLRGDWFIAMATRPPLYHVLTKLPETKEELQERLRIDADENLKQSQAQRAGMVKSGVSGQNRLLEYHPSELGAYWESYDFLPNTARSNLMRFPLGPKGSLREEFDRFAFEHAGGEIIYNLPNGLHGYMLTDGEGVRIDEGPVKIVWDPKETSGTPEIVNGISCMACHREGMLPIKDDVRAGIALANGEALRQVAALYATQDKIDRLLAKTRKDYLNSLEETIGPFLMVGPDADKKITDFPEPISKVAKLYYKDISLADAAKELGIENNEELSSQVRRNDDLKALGLGPLASDGSVKRNFWESREQGVSLMQEAARELGAGSPVQAN